MKIPREISDRVVVVGISPDGKGGIASVIRGQKNLMESFNFVKVGAEGWRKFVLPAIAVIKSLRYLPKKYKVVHVHACSDTDFYRSTLFIMLFKFMGKRVIMHMHGAMFEDFYSRKPGFVSNITGRCDMMIGVSNYFVDFFHSNKLNRRVRLLHNSIEGHKPDEPARREPHDLFTFSFFGAIDDRKGIFECIDAIGRHADSFRGKARFILAGNGDVPRLEALIHQYNISDMVEYIGWIDAEGKDRLLRRSDVFLHPSKFESFGISILEAMDYGLPVITTATGGITDLVTDGQNGLMVEAGSADSIYAAMTRLMNDPDLCRRLGDESSRRARQFYPDASAGRLRKLYEELLIE